MASEPFCAHDPFGLDGSRRFVQMKTCFSKNGIWGRLPPEQLARDDELLDLARPLVDAERPHLAVELLDLDAARDPEAAEELDRGIDDAAGGLGGVELGHGDG